MSKYKDKDKDKDKEKYGSNRSFEFGSRDTASSARMQLSDEQLHPNDDRRETTVRVAADRLTERQVSNFERKAATEVDMVRARSHGRMLPGDPEPAPNANGKRKRSTGRFAGNEFDDPGIGRDAKSGEFVSDGFETPTAPEPEPKDHSRDDPAGDLFQSFLGAVGLSTEPDRNIGFSGPEFETQTDPAEDLFGEFDDDEWW